MWHDFCFGRENITLVPYCYPFIICNNTVVTVVFFAYFVMVFGAMFR